MYLQMIKVGIFAVASALSIGGVSNAHADVNDYVFENKTEGRFEALDNRAAPGVTRYRLALRKGERIAFKMSLSLLPDRFTEARSQHSAAMGLRVTWRKADGSLMEATTPAVCSSTKLPNRKPTCAWVFEAPKDAALAPADDTYTLCVEDKTAPQPRRNFTWSLTGKRTPGKAAPTLPASSTTKGKSR